MDGPGDRVALAPAKRPVARRRLRWHQIYYLLALFDVVVVGMGIFLTHLIIDTHDDSIRINQIWEERLDTYLDLGTIAGEVNAPGNDVFDSRDVMSESARERQALLRFDALTATIREDLRDMAPEYAQMLGQDLDLLEAEMGRMTGESRRIFEHFESDRPDLAGSRMAAMDRQYQTVNSAVTRSREDIGDIQRELFAEQTDHAATLRNFEYLIAAAVVLMIACATGYGHRIKRELETRDAERAVHIGDLEASGSRLASANVALTTQITGRVEAEARLQLSEQRYALAARGANDGLWDWDLRTGEVYYSPRWKGLLGYDESDLSSRPGEWFERIHPDDVTDVHAQLEGASSQGRPFEIEHRLLHRDGRYRWMLARGLATTEDGRGRLVGSHSDVTARKDAERNLLHDSLHDSLTGLPNRVLFLERLDNALRRARQTSQPSFPVIYVDLDRFKAINDSLGHLSGDDLLVQFTALLQRQTRTGDTVARLGGDEFAILLDNPGSDPTAEATAVAQRILKAMEQPFSLDGLEVHMSASIGITLAGIADVTTAVVLRHADAALYRAKHEGRGRFAIFEPGEAERLLDDLRLEIDLRGAIARDEMFVEYQPIVELGSGILVGFEALARWTHPSLGPIPPSTFIPIAEECGDIAAIGEWVLRAALTDLSRFHDIRGDDNPVFMSVNVSSRQLLQPDFPSKVHGILTDTRTAPIHLRLEVTESAVITNARQAGEVLQQLRDGGVKICIDDFGTGHSSLSYVHDLPVDGLKIDRSFVERLCTGGNGSHIVRAILELARSTGLLVVAEGIETTQQQMALLDLGCGLGQGYLFDRPLALAAAEQRLRDEVSQAVPAAS